MPGRRAGSLSFFFGCFFLAARFLVLPAAMMFPDVGDDRLGDQRLREVVDHEILFDLRDAFLGQLLGREPYRVVNCPPSFGRHVVSLAFLSVVDPPDPIRDRGEILVPDVYPVLGVCTVLYECPVVGSVR